VDAELGFSSRVILTGAGIAARVVRLLAPRAFFFASGQQPAVTLSWGANEYRVGREGLQRRRRREAGWEDNPQSNYNEAVAKKQAKAAKKAL